MQRPSSCPRQDQERGGSDHGNKVEGEKEDKLGNLAERERAVNCRFGGLAEHFHGIWGVGEEDPRRGHEGDLSFVDECRLHEKEC